MLTLNFKDRNKQALTNIKKYYNINYQIKYEP
jgi:hypothetical protein